MQMRQRAAVLALGLAPLVVLAGCGDSSASGSSNTLQELTPGTNFVTIEPATTTTTTTLPDGDGGGGVSPTEQTYTVVAGDSMFKIASMFDITAEVLANYNGWSEGINHPLFPGDVVKIPPNAAVPGSGSAGDSGSDAGDAGDDGDAADPGDTGDDGDTGDTGDTDASSGEGCSHTVVAGDTPIKVANQYGIELDELANANIGNPSYQTFLIGSTLNIPPEGC
jgi:LysM repeat protein